MTTPTKRADPLAKYPTELNVSTWPTLPTLERYRVDTDHEVEVFTFSHVMLPSVNYKHDRSQRVRPAYHALELREVERIRLQRDLVGWTPPQAQDRYGIFYEFRFRSELQADLHNPIKPTCDLYGKGREETIRHGGRYVKRQVPYAQVITNDNRVLCEMQVKEVCPTRLQVPLWARIHLVRVPASATARFTLQSALEQISHSLRIHATFSPSFSL